MMARSSGLHALILGLFLALPASVWAQGLESLRVMNAGSTSQLTVALNRALVVESDEPFAELSVANPAIADIATLSDRTIYVLGKAPGRTTLTLLGPEGRLITNVDVHVTADLAEFKERLRQILPGEPIEVRSANDGIVLSGSVSSTQKLERALDLARIYAPEKVSNMLMVAGVHQVLLKVRFAEMQRDVSKNLTATAGISQNDTFLFGFPITGSGSFSGTAGTSFTTFGGVQFDILLRALEEKGMVRTLAEPNLSALSGQTASFLAGGEVPIPVDEDDSDGLTIEFKPFGVELQFTPTVLGPNQIDLKILTAVSDVDDSIGINTGGIEVPGFSRREASSTLQIGDGESFAIAGLLNETFSSNISQIPWIGDLPVLGALFRSTGFQRRQTELVIIVTAHLVRPMRGEALSLPTDRVRPPSESDLFLFGRTGVARTGAVGEVARQDFVGSYGYVME